VDGKVRVIDENRAEREVTEAEFNAIVKDVGAYLPASNRVRLPNGTTMPADKFRKHPKWHLGKGVTGKMRKGASPRRSSSGVEVVATSTPPTPQRREGT